jgi:hypothetical protein
MKREEAINAIVDSKIESLANNFEYLRSILIYGYRGIEDLSDEELAIEFEGEIGEEVTIDSKGV